MDIRKATPTDSLALSRLSRDVQSLHAQHHPTVFRMPESDDFAISFFEERLADPAVTIFIAEENGEELGCILCKLIERPETPFTFAVRTLLVDQISVRPEEQGQGIGAALMRQAEVLAAELQVQRILLDSWDFNTKAHKFFESRGFSKFTFRFWKWLSEK
jgi:ribosomal protein S18 acetylase RimI-like enzyme